MRLALGLALVVSACAPAPGGGKINPIGGSGPFEEGEIGGGGGGGGGGGPVGGGGPTFGEDGGDPAPPIATGAVAAVLETQSAGLDSYILRGTFPVPPNTFPRGDGLQPFTIYDYDGTPLETQTELVSRYANASDGADVVEVIARVRLDPEIATDAYTRFEVRQAPRNAAPNPGAPGVEDLSAPENLTPNVTAMLADPQSIEIAAYDVFGHKYVCYPLDGTGWKKLTRYGLVQTELRVFQTMEPETEVAGTQGTLPHLFGVHSYVSTFRGDDLIGLDLRFNNAHSGNDKGSDADDPLDRVYFDRIELIVPSNWFVEGAFEDPFFGGDVISNGKRILQLVEPNTQGKKHVMTWLGQTHRRLMLATSSLDVAAQKYVSDGAGQGFCVEGTDPDDEHEYWSWWNRGTARFGTQNYELPSLAHMNIDSLRTNEANAFQSLRNHLVFGTGTGSYPIVAGVLGWAHPWGVTYGGMTGGNEIFIYDGVTTANIASRLSTQRFKATHRMHTDRQPTALYNIDGEPTSPEDWLVGGEYVPFEHYNVPNLSTGDPFGLGDAPQFQINYAVSTGRTPPYEATLRSFQPHDYQHYVRYTRSAKVLAWLVNDSIAKDDLRMQAENYRLGYHPYKNSMFGFQGSGMKSDQVFVWSNPGVGFGYGRGEAWGADCVVAAYALSDPSYRADVLPWFQTLASIISDGQAACSGFIQANISPKLLNGLYRGRQQIEQSITESMLQGLRETVFRGADQARSDLVRDVLRDSLYGFVSDMNFIPGELVPPSMTAVGPVDVTKPVWCSFKQMPKNGWSPYKEGYQDWSSFAWGYELTGDPIFLSRALGQLGNNGSLYGHMLGGGVSNIENRAALIALVQRLNGM